MSKQQVLKSGIWYMVANFLMRSIGLITTPIFTRLLTHEEFGLYNNFTSWLSILTIFITLNLESTFMSARYDYEREFKDYILSVLVLSSLSCIIASTVLNTIYLQIQYMLGMSRIYLNAMLVYLFFFPAINLFQTQERYYFRYKNSVFLSLFVTVGTALVSIVLVIILPNKLDGRVYGSIAPSILVGIVLYFVICFHGKSIKIEYWKYAIKICIPYIPHLLSMTLLNSVDKIMITKICGAEDNSLYSLAYSCGTIVSILIISLNTAFAPWLGEKLHERKYKEINIFSKKYILLFIIFAFAMILFAPEALMFLGGRSYLNAIFVMPPIACGCICQFLYTMFVNIEQFSKKTIGMAIASASAALLNYILNLIFIPVFGYIAAAYTTFIGFVWLLIAHMLLVFKYGLGNVYPYKFILKTIIVVVCVMVGINFLYNFNWLRYLVGIIYIAILGAFIYKRKDTFLVMLNRMKSS